ncbi:GDSL esterase/lipase EXL3-like [Heracleum sosnowskyi]|uniref:GDSL esterase/lipase EXL3-like n=1 Tax=Heracleum sosnowskyi TaxID=360622 RepID=A0AAD8IVW5_9APIA|nr:GDSL esterase/lipase EXL3-like [Heracleum sosnowskyi]
MWFIVYVILISELSEALVNLPPNVTVPAVIAFGDSIVDQGMNNNINTIAKCNFPPYGSDLMDGTPTGRFCNARTPPDLIVEELGIKDLVPAYLDPNLQSSDLLTGVSFASGASGFDPQTPKLAAVLSLPDQLELFKEYIIAGTDDLLNTYFLLGARRLHYDVPSYADFVVNYASTFTQELYDLGARRIGVFGVPPIGCVPSQRTLSGGLNRDCVETYNQAAVVYNSKLSSQLETLGNSLPQSKILYIDIYNPLLDLIQNPQNYDLEVVDRGCCGTGVLETSVLCNKLTTTCPDHTKFLFWDSFHPTETGYKLLVKKVLDKYMNKFY